jgi:chromosome segregation ATPase
MADQKAQLQQQIAETQSDADIPGPAASVAPTSLVSFRRVASPPLQADGTVLVQMRQDLARAQTERADLQGQLDRVSRELETIKARSKQDSKRVVQMTATVNQLTLKLKDREEELKGKAKLIENVQDENVTLNLQLNMAEEQHDKLKKENKELVDRWMARMGKEADRMNDEHEFR